ncbi:MAG: LCP family protein, partial [Clostridia bacterium]|nr:LCP family protein [Clostridia bacterium]
MKKVVALILAAVLLLSFASCGKKPKVEETVSEEIIVSEPEVVSTESVAPVSSQPAKKKTQKQPRNPLKYNSSIVNIALFGLDTRSPKAFSGRADSMMILSLDQNRHTVKLVSVVRDSLVPIPGHGYGKINAAYAYGGADLA